MNKTIIININGTVFHIEETAYELLKEYMTDVKRHFFNSADSLEITTDIENRIAEMFTEILARESRQAVTEQDVQSVIAQMGSVKDFEYAEAEGGEAFTTPGNNYNYTSTQRRLFRDPDDHLIGGVCAGIANYFDMQAIWVRLAFAIAFAFFGSGLFLYLILWIIIPKALTRSDRMAMKGEPLDLQGFKRNFEAELNNVSDRLSDMRQDARPFVYKTRDFFQDFFHHLGRFLNGSGKIILKLLGIAVMLACTAGIIAVIVALFAAWVFGDRSHISLPMNFFEYQHINQVYVAVALLSIIPLVSIIILIARVVFNTTGMNRSAAYTLLLVWMSALVVLIYHGSKAATNFRESAGFDETVTLKATPNQVYYLRLNKAMFLTHDDSIRLDIKNKFRNLQLTDDDDNFEPRTVRIEIEKSDVPYPVLIKSFTARGKNYETALMNARNTRYVFSQQDSVLNFDYKLRYEAKEQWHGEEIKLTLRIPRNATVMVNDDVNSYINNYLNLNDCNDGTHEHKYNEAVPFVMTENGLQCKWVKPETTIKTDSTSADTTIVSTDTITETPANGVSASPKPLKPATPVKPQAKKR